MKHLQHGLVQRQGAETLPFRAWFADTKPGSGGSGQGPLSGVQPFCHAQVQFAWSRFPSLLAGPWPHAVARPTQTGENEAVRSLAETALIGCPLSSLSRYRGSLGLPNAPGRVLQRVRAAGWSEVTAVRQTEYRTDAQLRHDALITGSD